MDVVRVFAGIDEVVQVAGQRLGASPWRTIEQGHLDGMADAVGDADPRLLVLGLIVPLALQVYSVDGLSMSLNYGLEGVRFERAVAAGDRVRAVTRLLSTREGGGGTLATFETTIEIEGAAEPACVARTISLYIS